MPSTAAAPTSRPQGINTNTPFTLLLAYLFLEYTRLPSILRVLAILRVQLVILCVLLYFVFRLAGREQVANRATILMFVFAFICGLGTFIAPNTRAAFNMMMNILTYIGAGIVPMLLFANSLDKYRRLIAAWVGAIGFLGVWAVLHAGAGPSGFVSDENDCALVLNMAIPFAAILAGLPGTPRRKKLFYLGLALLLVLAVTVTLSRGGFLGLVAMGLVGFVFAKNRRKILLTLLAVAVPIAVVGPMLVPSNYVGEIESIEDPTDTTRLNRLYFWKLGWIMYEDNPVFGVGAGNYPWVVGSYEAKLPPEEVFRGLSSAARPCHSVYFTLFSEVGTAGTVVFLLLVASIVRAGLLMRRNKLPDPDERRAFAGLGAATLASCAAFCVTGAFISVLYYPPFWHLVGLAAAGAANCRLKMPRRQPTVAQRPSAYLKPGGASVAR
jgi:O-antigen ligase